MTAERRNPIRWVRPVLSLPALAVALAMTITPLLGAATTERIVIDPLTGVAIHGFDPVAYFTDRVAAAGRAELEFTYEGVVWRFRNAGNRAAFADHPDVYMPRFGGYDPVVLGRAVASPGHPQVWLIAENRLYMFHTRENRDTFAADPRRADELAQAKWPGVERALLP